MVTADYYYPYWECLVDFFRNPGLKSCWHGQPGIEPIPLDPSSQSGAYDLSATATPFKSVKVKPQNSDGSTSKFFDLGRVCHLWFGFEFANFPLKASNFSFFSLGVGSKSIRVKGRSASYLLQIKSKLGSGQGPSLPQHDGIMQKLEAIRYLKKDIIFQWKIDICWLVPSKD